MSDEAFSLRHYTYADGDEEVLLEDSTSEEDDCSVACDVRASDASDEATDEAADMAEDAREEAEEMTESAELEI